MASFILRPASPADAPAIADVHYRAMDKYHEFYAAFFALSPRDILEKLTAAAVQKPEIVYLVAVDEAGRVVGFVRYTVEAEKKLEAEKKPEAAVSAEAGPSPFAVKAHVKELWEEFEKKQVAMDGCYEKTMDGRRHICWSFYFYLFFMCCLG